MLLSIQNEYGVFTATPSPESFLNKIAGFMVATLLKGTSGQVVFHCISMMTPNSKKDRTENSITAQKMKFSIKYFFSKCDHISSFLQIRSHLLKKSLMENFIFFVECIFGSYLLDAEAYSETFRYLI